MRYSALNVLVKRIHDLELRRVGAKYLEGRMLDLGCGAKPYEQLLAPYVREHVGLDWSGSVHGTEAADLVGSAYAIPENDGAFDSIVCTAVLEHLEEPEQALRESYRVLKAGGVAIYTVPFIWHLHEEPRDFYRFSRYGLAYLFEKVGYDVIELKALSGFWVTFGQLFVYNMHRLNVGPLRWLRIVDCLGLLVQGLAYLLDRVDRTEQWTWMYLVVARKKSTSDVGASEAA